MVKRLTWMMVAFLMLTASYGCPPETKDPPDVPIKDEVPVRDVHGQKKVVTTTFPECFGEDKVGASTGVKCNYDAGAKEWRIEFWHGWGDCPAGCINTEVDARYVVDEKGRIFEAGPSFNRGREIHPSGPIYVDQVTKDRQGSQSKSKGTVEPAPLKHTFVEPPTAKKKVWIGRSSVVGQCEERSSDSDHTGVLKDPAANPAVDAPLVIKSSPPPDVTSSKKFTKWIEGWERERFEADKENFMCEACHVCKDFQREFRQVLLKDWETKPEAFMGWMRVDE